MRAVVSLFVASLLLSACTRERERPSGSAPPASDAPESTGTESVDSVPPISGGTLLITAGGEAAVVSDPDRHRVLHVDLDSEHVDEIELPKGTHPGRATEDADGFVHVVLRGAGTVLTLWFPLRAVPGA